MSFVFSELADCGHSACYAGIRNGTWCFLADWIPSRGIEISCYSFLLLVFFLFAPLCCYCANSASSKRHLVKLGMFVIGGKRVPVICRNVYEDNLHGATTRGNVDACWDPIKIFARLGRRRNRKNRINESAVTFSHFEVGCTLAIAG